MRRSRYRTTTTALISIVSVAAAVVAAMLTTSSVAPALTLAPAGHWVFNQGVRTAQHVDGGTGQVDAAVKAPDAGAASMALQGSDRGYLVAADRVTVFGKSTLTVESSFPLPGAGTEVPVGIETVGDPYLARVSGLASRRREPNRMPHRLMARSSRYVADSASANRR